MVARLKLRGRPRKARASSKPRLVVSNPPTPTPEPTPQAQLSTARQRIASLKLEANVADPVVPKLHAALNAAREEEQSARQALVELHDADRARLDAWAEGKAESAPTPDVDARRQLEQRLENAINARKLAEEALAGHDKRMEPARAAGRAALAQLPHAQSQVLEEEAQAIARAMVPALRVASDCRKRLEALRYLIHEQARRTESIEDFALADRIFSNVANLLSRAQLSSAHTPAEHDPEVVSARATWKEFAEAVLLNPSTPSPYTKRK